MSGLSAEKLKRLSFLLVIAYLTLGVSISSHAYQQRAINPNSVKLQESTFKIGEQGNTYRTKQYVKGSADSMFSSQKIINQSFIPNPYSLFTVDVDADGDKDMIVSSEDNGKLVWYEHKDNGIGESRVIEDLPHKIYEVTITDFNNDGRPDILAHLTCTCNSRIQGIYAYINQDKGFERKELINKDGMTVNSIVVHDVDQDNDEDLILGKYRSEHIRWYENSEDNFTGPHLIVEQDSTEMIFNVALYDFNMDGKKDLVASYGTFENYNNPNEMLVGYQRTDKGFDTTGVVIDSSYMAWEMKSIDIDKDGDQDLLTLPWNPKILLYENTGDSLKDPIQIDSVKGIGAIHATDVDSDNDWDLIAQTSVQNVSWYERTNGEYERRSSITDAIDGWVDFSSADFDNDGSPDYVGTVSKMDNIEVRYNQAGNFGSSDFIESSTSADVYELLTTDYNGDGTQDVISVSRGDHKIALYPGATNGFESQRVIGKDTSRSLKIEKADLNGDGDVDLIRANPGDKTVSWHENRSDGYSKEKVIADSLELLSLVRAGNLTDDNLPDLLVWSGTNLILFKNSENGFEEPTYLSQNMGPEASSSNEWNDLDLADVDSDGDLDIVTTSTWEHRVGKFINREDGFSDLQIINNDNLSGIIETGDIDGDQDKDIILGKNEGPPDKTIAYMINNAGNFSGVKGVDSMGYAEPTLVNVKSGDLNNDGLVDVVVRLNESSIYWVENDSASFSSPKLITKSAKGKGAIAISDINNDEYPDIISASPKDSKIAWYENRATSTATPGNKEIVGDYRLKQNYPNPFNPTTNINFSLPRASDVELIIYNAIGQKVATLLDKKMNSGSHTVTLDATGFPSGVYIYRLKANGVSKSRKMLLLK